MPKKIDEPWTREARPIWRSTYLCCGQCLHRFAAAIEFDLSPPFVCTKCRKRDSQILAQVRINLSCSDAIKLAAEKDWERILKPR